VTRSCGSRPVRAERNRRIWVGLLVAHVPISSIAEAVRALVLSRGRAGTADRAQSPTCCWCVRLLAGEIPFAWPQARGAAASSTPHRAWCSRWPANTRTRLAGARSRSCSGCFRATRTQAASASCPVLLATLFWSCSEHVTGLMWFAAPTASCSRKARAETTGWGAPPASPQAARPLDDARRSARLLGRTVIRL
jgi:hypothetical protein